MWNDPDNFETAFRSMCVWKSRARKAYNGWRNDIDNPNLLRFRVESWPGLRTNGLALERRYWNVSAFAFNRGEPSGCPPDLDAFTCPTWRIFIISEGIPLSFAIAQPSRGLPTTFVEDLVDKNVVPGGTTYNEWLTAFQAKVFSDVDGFEFATQDESVFYRVEFGQYLEDQVSGEFLLANDVGGPTFVQGFNLYAGKTQTVDNPALQTLEEQPLGLWSVRSLRSPSEVLIRQYKCPGSCLCCDCGCC